MTKVFEQGLNSDDLSKKAELVKQLGLRLGYIRYAVEQYNELVEAVNAFIHAKGQQAEAYYDARSVIWRIESDNVDYYEAFKDKWKDFELDEIDLATYEDQLEGFEQLPDAPNEA
jgi:hypothetical protein